MQRCIRCSTLALEVFVQDFSGINLRRNSQPTAIILSKSHNKTHPTNNRRLGRNFGTCSTLRSLQHNVVSPENTIVKDRIEDVSSPSIGSSKSNSGEDGDITRVDYLDTSASRLESTQQRKDKIRELRLERKKDELYIEKRKQKKLDRKKDGTFRPQAKEVHLKNTKPTQNIQPVERLDDLLRRAEHRQSKPQESGISSSPPSRPSRSPQSTLSSTITTTHQNEQGRTEREPWQIQKSALAKKFAGQAWSPRKRLSPDTLDGIRRLHASDPATYSTPVLAEHFSVTPDAIRRILKSRWLPSAAEREARLERWERRGARKWAEMAELGMRPPGKWRGMGIGGKGGDERVGTRGGGGEGEVREWGESGGRGMREKVERDTGGNIPWDRSGIS